MDLLDLFTNGTSKEYLTYNQIEQLDSMLYVYFSNDYPLDVEYTRLDVEFQYVDEDKQMLILSDDAYNQHEVPLYLFRGHLPVLQGMCSTPIFT